jgi:predicted ATP-grasp superfamily ATP-dependent carboligase
VINTSVPVVVIFRGGYGAIAVARTLGRLGVSTYLVAQERMPTPVWSSRYWVKKVRWDFSRPEEESVDFLLKFGEKIRAHHGWRPILFTLADWVAVFIERHARALEEQFLFPQPVQPVLQSLLNKWEMHLLAGQHQIPTPRTAKPDSVEDAEAFVRAAGLPVVMKAADRYEEDPPPTNIVHSREALIDEVGRREITGKPLNLVLQEYIPGDADSVWMCNGYFGADAEREVIYTGKKLRQVSAAGIASLAVCLPNDTVASQTQRFMEGVGYRGCVGIGWRHDQRDGSYKLLDVNARVSGVFRLFAGTSEMDVVRACYLDLTGQEIPKTALQPGRKWMLEDDVFAAMAAMRNGRLSVSEWMRSVRGVREWHWFAWDDPIPIFVWLGDRVRQAARYTVNRDTQDGRVQLGG